LISPQAKNGFSFQNALHIGVWDSKSPRRYAMDFLKLQTLNHIFPQNKNKKERGCTQKKRRARLVLCHPLV